MSFHNVKNIPILPNEVRDFYLIDEGAGAYQRDLWNRDGVVGLDWHVFNDGAAPLTITLDGMAVTVPVNGDLGMDNVKYAIIQCTAIQHRLVMTGIVKGKARV